MPFFLDSAIGFLVARTSHVLRSAFHRTLSATGHDITPEEWGILNRLGAQDGQRPGDLADTTIRDRSTVTRLVDGLVRKGWVRREVDPSDRRSLQTWLTPEGRALRSELAPVVAQFLRQATHGMSDRELDITIKALRKLQANLIEIEDENN